MDKRSKILFYMFLVFIIISAILTYYRTMIIQDYTVINTASVGSDTSLNTDAAAE